MAGGAFYAATGSVPAAAACSLSHILIDVDHLVDYFALAKERFTPRAFRDWCYGCEGAKFLLPLHSYELFALLVLWAATHSHPVLSGTVAGIGVHLAMDQYGNRGAVPGFRLSKGFYFLAWRAKLDFRKDRLLVPE